jgi:hypothetical protein
MDVGFGDAVTPGPIDVEFPTLLDQPAPRLRAYPRETVVAEKVEILVSLGMDAAKRAQWSSFLRKSRLTAEAAPLLGDVVAELRVFLLPPLGAARAGEALRQRWIPGGPWQPD